MEKKLNSCNFSLCHNILKYTVIKLSSIDIHTTIKNIESKGDMVTKINFSFRDNVITTYSHDIFISRDLGYFYASYFKVVLCVLERVTVKQKKQHLHLPQCFRFFINHSYIYIFKVVITLIDG